MVVGGFQGSAESIHPGFLSARHWQTRFPGGLQNQRLAAADLGGAFLQRGNRRIVQRFPRATSGRFDADRRWPVAKRSAGARIRDQSAAVPGPDGKMVMPAKGAFRIVPRLPHGFTAIPVQSARNNGPLRRIFGFLATTPAASVLAMPSAKCKNRQPATPESTLRFRKNSLRVRRTFARSIGQRRLR